MKKNSFVKIVKILFAVWFAVFSCNYMFALELYKSDAVVSFYGDAFHGKQTSSGEKYDMYDLTCANKSLPFGTLLKITNLSNGKSVQVRVNDRGPFVPGRECDLSKAAAQKIDMIGSGTTHVKIEIVKRGEDTNLSKETAEAARKLMEKKYGKQTTKTPEPETKKTQEKPVEKKPVEKTPEKTEKKDTKTVKEAEDDITKAVFDIQVASFKDKDNANKYANQLIKKGFKNVVLRRSGETYRVVIKDIPQKKLGDTEEKLISEGIFDFMVKRADNK